MPQLDTSSLKKVAPFHLLPDEVLQKLLKLMKDKQLKSDEVLYEQNESTLQGLSLVMSGKIEKYFLDEEGHKSYREEFLPLTTFGSMSILLGTLTAIRTTRAIKPSYIYTLPTEDFLYLAREYEEFGNFFTQQLGKRMLQSGYVSFVNTQPGPESGFQGADHTFTETVSDAIIPPIFSCYQDQTIEEVASIMTHFDKEFVLIKNREEAFIGILTDRDLRMKVVASALSPQEEIAKVMEQPIPAIHEGAYKHEAILNMFQLQRRYLGVESEGEIIGTVSLEQLLHNPTQSPFIFIRSIQRANEVEELASAWLKVPAIVGRLIERGMRPEIVNQVVSGIVDAITQRIIHRAMDKVGNPPTAFVFIATGSEGRMEQTLATDQDNAIIYDDPHPEDREHVAAYFLELAKHINFELNQVGFGYCEHKAMAQNPKWNQPLLSWKKYFEGWIKQPTTTHLLESRSFFDARNIFGDPRLLQSLKTFVFNKLEGGANTYFQQEAREALIRKPPLTFFRGFKLTEQANKRKGLDIKDPMNALVELVRIYSLRHEIEATNTGKRLAELKDKKVLSQQEYQEIHQSYYFMMRLRLQHQTSQIKKELSPDNLIPLGEITKIEQVTLKEIFRVIEKFQQQMSMKFSTTLSS
ncbi:MAG: DUF294 nucleotidyltransferase-like domain-containing protein [Bacteroidota bacterium]